MEVNTEEAVTQHPRYHRANAWPEEIPSLSRIEAERAVRKLWKKFGNGRSGSMRIRRVWVTAKPPFNKLHRGWRRLVHDMSHRIHPYLHPNHRRPHNPRHEFLEGEMVGYVLASGWLSGKLKPPEKPKRPAQEVRYERIVARLSVWERKWKRAQTAIRKLKAQKMYYERQRT